MELIPDRLSDGRYVEFWDDGTIVHMWAACTRGTDKMFDRTLWELGCSFAGGHFCTLVLERFGTPAWVLSGTLVLEL